jgi:hypothetical protein
MYFVKSWWREGFQREIDRDKSLNEIMVKELNCPTCEIIKRTMKKFKEGLMEGLLGCEFIRKR